jgi:hypothetical protein
VTPNPAPSEEDDTSSSPSRDDDEAFADAISHQDMVRKARAIESQPPSEASPSWEDIEGRK